MANLWVIYLGHLEGCLSWSKDKGRDKCAVSPHICSETVQIYDTLSFLWHGYLHDLIVPDANNNLVYGRVQICSCGFVLTPINNVVGLGSMDELICCEVTEQLIFDKQ